MSETLVCPECGDAVRRLDAPMGRYGALIDVEPKRLRHAHDDGTPLCPVMTSTGYQPALPATTR